MTSWASLRRLPDQYICHRELSRVVFGRIHEPHYTDTNSVISESNQGEFLGGDYRVDLDKVKAIDRYRFSWDRY